MHSLYIQWMPQWIEMTNNCFSVQPLCIQGHGILGPWVLAVEFGEHEISSFMCHFFIMLPLSLSFSAFLQWFSLIVSSGPSCSLYVHVCVCVCVCKYMCLFEWLYSYCLCFPNNTRLLHVQVNVWILCVYACVFVSARSYMCVSVSDNRH